MKLGWKIVLLLLAVSFALLGALGYVEIRRSLRDDSARVAAELATMGRALRSTVNEVHRVEGRDRAADVVRRADDDIDEVQIGWFALDEPVPLPAIELDAAQRANLASGGEVILERATDAQDWLHVYVPVSKESALALSQPLAAEQTIVRSAMEGRLVGAALAVLGAGVLAALASVWVVGRPMSQLAEQARRIGSGDLAHRLDVKRRDEIGELASEMNAMCDRLLDAQARIAAAAEARVRTLEQLRRADRLSTVGTLASGMAHELGTPLSIIGGRAKMIAVTNDGTETGDLARIILGQTERMTRIMRGLLDFARRKPAEKKPSDLRELARRTIDLLTPLAKKHGVSIVLADGPAAFAEIDVAQVEQALANLIVNGIHATDGAGEIVVSAAMREDSPSVTDTGLHACLSVRDAGHGIPSDHVAHLFEPFFTTKAVGEGTGLGLSVTYGIMQDHGGFVDVASVAGEGSVFSLWFPRQGAAA